MRAPGRRAAAVLGVAAAVLLGPVGPASAHNQLRGTAPADGAVVDTAPASVVLTFDQPVIALGTEVVVLGPDGSAVSAGEPRLVDDDVTQDLAGDLPAGAYRVEWRATSADGHPVSGELDFTASGPGAGAVAATTPAAPTPSAAVSTTSPAAPGVVAVVVVALAAAVVVVLRRRGPRRR